MSTILPGRPSLISRAEGVHKPSERTDRKSVAAGNRLVVRATVQLFRQLLKLCFRCVYLTTSTVDTAETQARHHVVSVALKQLSEEMRRLDCAALLLQRHGFLDDVLSLQRLVGNRLPRAFASLGSLFWSGGVAVLDSRIRQTVGHHTERRLAEQKRLRMSQNQPAIGSQRIVKDIKSLVHRLIAEVDQHVPAHDHVERPVAGDKIVRFHQIRPVPCD